MTTKVQTGIDFFLQQSIYKKKRIGFVTNNAAFTSAGIPSRLALVEKGFSLVKLFSPEHGLSVKGADGVYQENTIDSLTQLPVISLYGDRLAPTEEDLHDIDLVLFDIPDVGCRFYTYLWTMTHVMEACAIYGKPFLIADRPNPISGELKLAEGPWLDEEHCASFIGRWSIPIRHSCTLGELALYFGATKMKGFLPEVLKISPWERDQFADEINFVPTSPAIRNPQTALIYPGLGLLEGIEINEGRGTEKPFQVCGAPWINKLELFEAFIKKENKGLMARPCSFTPSEGVFGGQFCHGLEFSISDAHCFCPVSAGIHLLQTIVSLYPDKANERLYRTRANPSGTGHLDKLLGVKDSFEKIKRGELIHTAITQEWTSLIQPYLLY